MAPKNLDLKNRGNKRETRGNTGIHGLREGWGLIPPKEKVKHRLEKSPHWRPCRWCFVGEEVERRGGEWVWEEEKLPDPPLNPQTRAPVVVPLRSGGSTA